jgi:conjugative transfer signal peptidase TraF
MMPQDTLTTSCTSPAVRVVPPWPWSTKLLAAFAVVAICSLPWYRLNLTSSAPRGVWLIHRVPPVVERGMWVSLPVPTTVASWLPSRRPLLKPVAAVAGERVCVKEETLWIRGMPYGRIYTQAHGKPLPHLLEGCFDVAPGRVFLASQAPHSMDSRYFGSVPVTTLTAQATPLWTWR